MIIRDKYREPSGSKLYKSTSKDIPLDTFNKKEDAYYMLSGLVDSKLGPEGGTIAEIYHKVTGPMGLSASDTTKLVFAAKKEGYLE